MGTISDLDALLRKSWGDRRDALATNQMTASADRALDPVELAGRTQALIETIERRKLYRTMVGLMESATASSVGPFLDPAERAARARALTEAIEPRKSHPTMIGLIEPRTPSSDGGFLALRCTVASPRPPQPLLVVLSAAVAEAVRDCVTIATLLDPATSSSVAEEVAYLLGWSSTPAWPQRAERTTHAEARQRALLEAIVDARELQPRLRIGTKEYGQHMAPITLPRAEREAWVLQRARRYLGGKVRRENVPMLPPDEGAAEGMERLLSLTMPNDENWPEDATPLLGSAVREVWPYLHRDDRERILTTFTAKLKAGVSD